jgi:hypothetical protein
MAKPIPKRDPATTDLPPAWRRTTQPGTGDIVWAVSDDGFWCGVDPEDGDVVIRRKDFAMWAPIVVVEAVIADYRRRLADYSNTNPTPSTSDPERDTDDTSATAADSDSAGSV